MVDFHTAQDHGRGRLQHEQRREPRAARADQVLDARPEVGFARARRRVASDVFGHRLLELDHDLARRERADERAVRVHHRQRAAAAPVYDPRQRVI